ncbi:T9SS type A sorting domain-containing protein [Hymenobacter convexus]|uniref:T9SS type A sorting domain-containing protein n=1 Tax=Hymenobacter sp. CA1UV-4 TaxID=3063782 RepID=UPI002712CB4A|nr:T9SS type A sorting domain-containing protein [Hymenobacter sp. CA1UV-4]MDO7850967.1 T9SS type A sorting domain-containing protein [Hymenobacter sp. CA1UV-4]
MTHSFSTKGLLTCLPHPLALLGLLAMSSAAHAQTAATFAPAATYSTGTASLPYNVALGDLNNDGRLDLVTVNQGPETAGILLGQAGGGFGAAVAYSIGTNSRPVAVAVGDVNGDGNPDVVTSNNGSNSVGVFVGNGTGGLSPVVTYATGTSSSPNSAPAYVALGDVNGDGRLDIVVANNLTASVGVLLGLGGGGFAAVTTYSTGVGSQPVGVALGDVNGDGRLDIVTGNSLPGTVGVLLGQAGGGFGAVASYSDGLSRPTTVALGDVNGDGRLDVLVDHETLNTVGVLLGQAGGGLALAGTYSTGTNSMPTAAVLGDVNGDSQLDIVTVLAAGSAGVLLGQGNGSFGAITNYSAGAVNTPIGGALGDVNNDGRLDIVTVNNSSNDASVLLNTTAAAALTLTSLNPTSGAVGTSITLTGTGLTGATGVRFNGTAATTFAVVNATTVTATVPTGATSGPVTVTTPSGTSNGLAFTVTYPDLMVSTGTQLSPTVIPAGIYNSITITGSGNAVLAGNVSVNAFFAVQPGGGLSDGCAIISGAGSFSLGAGSILGICNAAGISNTTGTGAVQVTGTRSYSSLASYGYTGAAAATGSSLPSAVANLAINTSGNVSLTAPVTITVALGVGGTGNLVLGGNALTLASSAAGTALVVNSSSGVVQGTATVQRYIDPSLNPGPGYRHYSSPVANATVADLTTAGFSPVVNPAYNTSATPNTTVPFPTVYGYDQSRVTLANSSSAFDRGFFSPSTTADPLVPGQGYTVNIAGTQLVDFSGTLTNGPVAQTLSRLAGNADAGWQLLGNPYPAPLDYSLVAPADRAGLDGAIYVYSSTAQYAGQYRSYVNGIGGNSVLPVGQGFFVRVSAGQTSGTLTFRNSQRLTAPNATAFQRTTTDPRPLVQLELRGATGAADALYAYAEAGATPAFDTQYDAMKLPNTTGLNLSSSATSGEALSIDGRPAFTAATALPLNVGVPAAGTYTLIAAALDNLPAGLDALLTDAATGQTVNLRTQPGYSFAVTTAQAQALLTGRFTLHFAARAALATATALTAAEVTVYPNPAHGQFSVLVPAVAGAAQVQGTLLNALGQVVRQQSATATATGARLGFETQGLAVGVYTLRLRVGAVVLAKRVVLQ